MSETACPFCDPDPDRVFHRGTRIYALWDAFPVTEGHALIVTNNHVPTWFDATRDEQTEILSALTEAKEAILAARARGKAKPPDGFNIGVNIDEAAGQTIPHLHVHLIPRYKDDVQDPRGGVRNVIPAKANYLLEREHDNDNPPDRVADRPITYANALVTGERDPLLPHLRRHLAEAQNADLLAAFILDSGVTAIQDSLEDLLDRGGCVRLLTGDYLGITEPRALLRVLDLSRVTMKYEHTLRERSEPGALVAP